MSPSSRNIRNGLLVGFITLSLGLMYVLLDIMLLDPILWSGWLMIAIILFLAAYNLRKKFSLPVLISSRIWLRAHIGVALVGIIVFFLHTESIWPLGIVERVLMIFWLIATISGFVGLFLTRTFPRRLTGKGQDVVFEVIPERRRIIRLRVEALAENSIERTLFTTVSYFFTDHLRDFFYGPKNTLQHLFGGSLMIDRMIRQIENKKKYLNETEKSILSEIAENAVAKDNLDFHFSLQLVLKIWLFVHIPVTYSLILMAVVHIIFVYSFSGRGV